MMAIEICKKCGYPNQKGAVKCQRCGNLLSAGQIMGLIVLVVGAIIAGIYALFKLYIKLAKKNDWPIPGFIQKMEEKRERKAAEEKAAEERAARLAEAIKVPFEWEADFPKVPHIPDLPAVEALKDITQEHIDAYAANEREFWVAYHQSLQAPYSSWSANSGMGLKEWVGTASNTPDIVKLVETLQKYIIVKGEYPVATAAAHLLTNYRLMMLIDQTMYNIPLKNLKTYATPMGSLDLEWTEDGEERSLSITGTILTTTCVDGARQAKSWQGMSSNQELLLATTRFDLGQASPDLSLPEVGFIDIAPPEEPAPSAD